MQNNKTESATTETHKNLYSMLDRCTFILANQLEQGLENKENFELYDSLSEYNNDYYNSLNVSELESYGFDTSDHPILETVQEMKINELREIQYNGGEPFDLLFEALENWISDQDYPDIYQTYIIDEHTYDILKDFGQIVYYNEDIDSYFWGVTHWGTEWSHVMSDVFPVNNLERYEKS